VSAIAAFGATHLPPLVPSGATLSDPAQADYAHNLWSSVRLSLIALAAILPWLMYGLVPRWPAVGRSQVLTVASLGVVFAGLFSIHGLVLYAQPPVPINGTVSSFAGRDISLCALPSHHLLISDAELREVRTWVRPGSSVLLYVPPGGEDNAGYLGPAQVDLACAHSGLAQ
jgi:hypothetical protein